MSQLANLAFAAAKGKGTMKTGSCAEPKVMSIDLSGYTVFWYLQYIASGIPGARGLFRRLYRRKRIDAYGRTWGEIEEALEHFSAECGTVPQVPMRKTSLIGKVLVTAGRQWLIVFVLLTATISLSDVLTSNFFFLGITAAAAALVFIALSSAAHKGQQLTQPSAGELRVHDPRRPIILLRSFSEDQKRIIGLVAVAADLGVDRSAFGAGAGQTPITDWFREFGPLIAIGKPGEKRPSAGAARQYVPDQEWQDVVRGLIEEARLIIIILGHSHGLRWELETILDGGHIGKALFLFPRTDARNWSGMKRNWSDFRMRWVADERARIWSLLCECLPTIRVLTLAQKLSLHNALAAHVSPRGDLVLIRRPGAPFLDVLDLSDYSKAAKLGIYGMFCRNRTVQ